MELTKSQLQQILPKNPYIDYWFETLSQLFPDYDINTPQRMASFMAQCAHESNEFTALKENLNYRPESLRKLFGKYFPTDELAKAYCAMPDKQAAIANRIYANRMGNGDEHSGDGYTYCGRGLVQLTGKANYRDFADSIGVSVEEATEYMHTFEGAAQSACWFWETHNLNVYADSGDFVKMTKIINGGTIGLEDRIKHYDHAMQVFGA